MLGVRHASELGSLWEELESKAALLISEEEFFAAIGPVPVMEGCFRAYERYYLRCRAIARKACEAHAVYVQDCSRQGMGFVSPVQFFPRDHIELTMDKHRTYRLEIKRCRRHGPQCYECGTIFVLK